MAYFSNGTEGMLYQEQWCCRCIHFDKCPIWLAHLSFNYEQLSQREDQRGPLREALEMLIPVRPDGFADKCRMFVEAVKVHSGPIPAHYKQWAKKQGLVEVSEEQFKVLP